MQKEKLKKLIEIIKRNGLESRMDEILEFNEYTLDLLLKCNNNIVIAIKIIDNLFGRDLATKKLELFAKLCEKGLIRNHFKCAYMTIGELKILNEMESPKFKYAYDILTDKELKKKNYNNVIIDILKECKNLYSFDCAITALKNRYFLGDVYNSTIIEGAKIISKMNISLNAYYASRLLMYDNAVDVQKGIRMIAELDHKMDDGEKAKKIYEILTNPDIMYRTDAINYASEIARAKNKFNVENVYKLLTNIDVINAGIALDAARLINEATEEESAICLSNLLKNKSALNAEIALKLAKLASSSKKDYISRCIPTAVNDFTIDAGIALEVVKTLLESKNYFNALYLCNLYNKQPIVDSGLALPLAEIINCASDAETAKRIYGYIMKNICFVTEESDAYLSRNNNKEIIENAKKILNNEYVEENMGIADEYLNYLETTSENDIKPSTLKRKL